MNNLSPPPLMLNTLSDIQLIARLKDGGVGVLPSDTIYGLVCRAADPLAVQRLYKLKDREQKPGTVIASSIDQLVEINFKARYLKAVENYWPGPVSVVIPCVDLAYLHQGMGSVPIRISADKTLNNLIEQVGPLLTTSANHPGKPPANNIEEALAYFGKTVDFYIDGGDLTGRQGSTIIRIVDDAIEVLRSGAVTIDPTTGKIISK